MVRERIPVATTRGWRRETRHLIFGVFLIGSEIAGVHTRAGGRIAGREAVATADRGNRLTPRSGSRPHRAAAAPPAPRLFQSVPSARSTTSGVMGCAVTRAPSGARASFTAFSTAPGAPAVPASPAPLKPPSA